jgi:hypothetical protein
MYGVDESVIGCRKPCGIDLEDAVYLVRPVQLIANEIQLPVAHMGTALRLVQPCLALAQHLVMFLCLDPQPEIFEQAAPDLSGIHRDKNQKQRNHRAHDWRNSAAFQRETRYQRRQRRHQETEHGHAVYRQQGNGPRTHAGQNEGKSHLIGHVSSREQQHRSHAPCHAGRNGTDAKAPYPA